MLSSDSVAGAQEQTSSELSLETTLGCQTEVGLSTMASSLSSNNPGLSDPTFGYTSESSREDTPPLIKMESEGQGQLQLLPSLVSRPTTTAQAVGAQLEQPRKEKVTAPSQAEPLPAGLVAASGGQDAPSPGNLLLQMMQRKEHMMQRQEQQQGQMQHQMQAAQEAQIQLLTLLAQQMQQSQGAAELVAAPPPAGGLATRGPIQGSIQNPRAETPIVHILPQGCQEFANQRPHICLYRSQRDEMSESGRTIHSHPPSHLSSPPLRVVNQRARTDVWVEENLDRIEVVSTVMQRQEYAPSEASSVQGATPLVKAVYSLKQACFWLKLDPSAKGEKLFNLNSGKFKTQRKHSKKGYKQKTCQNTCKKRLTMP